MDEALLVKYETAGISSVYGTYARVEVKRSSHGRDHRLPIRRRRNCESKGQR